VRVAVIDGQGGGIGKLITEKIRKTLPPEVEIIALGTNAMATSLMLRAGANDGASGENAIMVNCPEADVIIGSLSILIANSMLGELTPNMAKAVAESKAIKLIIPLTRSAVEVIGARKEPLPHQIDLLIEKLQQILVDRSNYKG
jgi:hypothetical protein